MTHHDADTITLEDAQAGRLALAKALQTTYETHLGQAAPAFQFRGVLTNIVAREQGSLDELAPPTVDEGTEDAAMVAHPPEGDEIIGRQVFGTGDAATEVTHTPPPAEGEDATPLEPGDTREVDGSTTKASTKVEGSDGDLTITIGGDAKDEPPKTAPVTAPKASKSAAADKG